MTPRPMVTEDEAVAVAFQGWLEAAQNGRPQGRPPYNAENIRLFRSAFDAGLADRERMLPWLPVIAQVESQAERWKIPMPGMSEPGAALIWALKASEEMGELSAALLGRAIGKDGRGDPLEECYQLMAVLLRVAELLLKEAGR